jgi:hypothetical protein
MKKEQYIMKNLILILFAIVTFGLAVNAQDLSFKTYNQTIKPKGDLFATITKSDDYKDYIYHEWDEYSVTVMTFVYYTGKDKVTEAREEKVFFDELDFEKVIMDESPCCSVGIPIKKEKNSIPFVRYEEDNYKEGANSGISFSTTSKAEAIKLLAKLKEKAFDMSLELDANVQRVERSDIFVYDERNPDGVIFGDWLKAKENEAKESQSKSNTSLESDDDSTSSSSSSSDSDNNSTPKAKTNVNVTLVNKFKGEIEITIVNKGNSKRETWIAANGRKNFNIDVGGKVLGANGAVLLVITAEMDKTDQVIFK